MADQPASYASGTRLPYTELPSPVKSWVEDQLGEPVAQAVDQRGGFSPGVAATVHGVDGAGVFIKAVTDAINTESLRLFRAERDLGDQLPKLPGILTFTDTCEFTVNGDQWLILSFPLITGHPPGHPWALQDAVSCLDLLDRLGSELTPSPWPTSIPAQQRMIDFLTGWQKIAGSPQDPWLDDPWVQDHLEAEIEFERELAAAIPGDTLSHSDLRADNIMMSGGRPYFVDWAHARNLARWFDPLLLIADIIASGADIDDGGGIDIAELLRTRPACRFADHDLQLTFLSSYAATQHDGSRMPPVPRLERLRPWQAHIAEVILGYVRRHR